MKRIDQLIAALPLWPIEPVAVAFILVQCVRAEFERVRTRGISRKLTKTLFGQIEGGSLNW